MVLSPLASFLIFGGTTKTHQHLFPMRSSSFRPFSLAMLALSFTALILSCEKSPEEEPQVSSNTPPGAFSLVFISDNADEIALTPYLTWTASIDSDGDAVTYDLIMDETAILTSNGQTAPSTVIQAGITSNSFTLTTALSVFTEYSWCVIAKDGNGGSTKSTEIFSFRTTFFGTANTFPSGFNLLTPANQSMDVSLSPNLSWQASLDADQDPIVYDVFLDQGLGVTPTTMISQGNSATSTIPLSLNADTDYTWRVVARDIHGAATACAQDFSFRTGDNSPNTLSLVTSSAITGEEGRFGHQALVYDNKLWVLGGWVVDGNGGGRRNDVWNSSDGVNWTQVRAHDPNTGFYPSDEHQAIVYDGLMYVFNGTLNTIHTSSDGVNWESLITEGSVPDGTMYLPRQGHQVIVVGDEIWLIGGSSGGIVQNDVWISQDGGVNWVEISITPFPARTLHQVVDNGIAIYVIGGLVNGVDSDDIWISFNGSDWEELITTGNWAPRKNHQCTFYQGEIILSGGDGVGDYADLWGSGAIGEDWFEYDTNIDYLGREGHQTVVFNGELYVLFGKSGTLALGDIWKF